MRNLVEKLGYNKIYLCKKFKNTVGKTIGEYVRDMRLQAAEDMLRTTDFHAARICSIVGIKVSPTSTKFSKRHGVSPTKYRRQLRSKDV